MSYRPRRLLADGWGVYVSRAVIAATILCFSRQAALAAVYFNGFDNSTSSCLSSSNPPSDTHLSSGQTFIPRSGTNDLFVETWTCSGTGGAYIDLRNDDNSPYTTYRGAYSLSFGSTGFVTATATFNNSDGTFASSTFLQLSTENTISYAAADKDHLWGCIADSKADCDALQASAFSTPTSTGVYYNGYANSVSSYFDGYGWGNISGPALYSNNATSVYVEVWARTVDTPHAGLVERGNPSPTPSTYIGSWTGLSAYSGNFIVSSTIGSDVTGTIAYYDGTSSVTSGYDYLSFGDLNGNHAIQYGGSDANHIWGCIADTKAECDALKPHLVSLEQYKTDATTTLSEGATTTESTVVFGAILNSSGTDELQLQVEVQPAGTDFTDDPTASSSLVVSGHFATTTFSSSTAIDLNVYPRDPELWSNGSFHWQARVRDVNTGAMSSWQLFGSNSSSTDFVIGTVPLYTQKVSPYPSSTLTASWANNLYDNSSTIDCVGSGATSTIAACGCVLSDIAMTFRYFGVSTDTVGNQIDPGNLNTWMTNNGGYDESGNVIWGTVPSYISSKSITFDPSSTNYDISSSGVQSYVDGWLNNSSTPVILRERQASHWLLATGLANNAGTSTYTVRDPNWYKTLYLNQTSTTSTIKNYSNNIDTVRVYYDPPNPPTMFEYHVPLPHALMLVDSHGRRTGKDPATGVIYHEIPNTSYTEDGTGPTNTVGELFAWNGSGLYKLYVLGGATGSYWIDASPRQEVRGAIQRGAMTSYAIDYNSTSRDYAKLIFRAAASSTASITSLPPNNLPLR